jgi:hypothetical protein
MNESSVVTITSSNGLHVGTLSNRILKPPKDVSNGLMRILPFTKIGILASIIFNIFQNYGQTDTSRPLTGEIQTQRKQ